MTTAPDFLPGLRGFADQFRAQIRNAGVPHSEHAVHFCLALGIEAAYKFPPGSIVFERPAGAGRLDLAVAPLDLIIEVKFRRPIPSGRNLPATQLYGSLLADFNKVAHASAGNRMVVFVSDTVGVDYLRRSGRAILPLVVGTATEISPDTLASLPITARTNAVADAPWLPIRTNLLWTEVIASWSLFAWMVVPTP